MNVYLAVQIINNEKAVEVFESETEEQVVAHILKSNGYYDYENPTNVPIISKIDVYKLETASYKVFDDLDKKFIEAFTKYQLEKTEREERELLAKLKAKYEPEPIPTITYDGEG